MEPTHTFKFKTDAHDMTGTLNLTGIPTITVDDGMMEMSVVQLEAFNRLIADVDAIKKVFGGVDKITFIKIIP